MVSYNESSQYSFPTVCFLVARKYKIINKRRLLIVPTVKYFLL